ncbi:DUF484 family protein [Xenophilus arseniciresistens]|uniref:DUF484 family protein n=1 Tax=Xenophilus arseniciresistens TaxID=1283306 RepID=A0AAE3NB09_9BURK|nr:DUF484 family protein [Xenophilus arseniciresistens]MDA7417864.1 DUF484 family protein [Xenophilus arseniciresistens]
MITEDDIANYLAITPDFFERHAQLLAQVQLTSPHGNRAVSLQERQAEMLREKIKALEHRIMDMVRHGTENVMTADRLQRWTRTLLTWRDTRQLPWEVLSGLQRQFMVPQTGLKLWDLDAAYAEEGYVQNVSDDVKALATSLTTPYCGLNAGFEAASWLNDPQQAVSLALLPLRAEPEQPAFGLLVLASPDAQRYHAEMGTDFLERIGQLAGAALSRLRA